MITNLIIGAGQLGSRHLQGLLKYNKKKQRIYVIDPSQDALNISIFRAAEIQHEHQIYFLQNLENLPELIDIAIIATNADVREQIVTQLLSQYSVNYLILEKVLFTDLGAYSRISELITNKIVKTWVNHPRRMFNSYKELKQMIGNGFKGVFLFTGSNWGLGCNGLHFIDFFEFLSDSKVESINAERVEDEILTSKRKGFVEFTGTIKGRLENGSIFQISSLQGELSASTIDIFNSENRFIIHESGNPAIYHYSKSKAFKQEIFPFTMEFQSSLTTRLIDDLLSTGNCELPTYVDASHSHKLFIKTLLVKYNKLTEADSHILPIT